MEYQIAAPTAVKLHLKVQPKYINCALAKNGKKKKKKKKEKKKEEEEEERKKTQEYMKCKGTSSA
jgi:ribosomal protein L12E/L44/L45/RPP1/RPP2